ncbi:hypothetical protein [Phenylobacterium sp.]|uniref:hypothetical protein n=1 Tax=Phenylobacterium sp. TaxID=1871053 RepID=UPI002F3FD477
MAKGAFSYRNQARTAALSGGLCGTGLPLANMQKDAAYVSRPTRWFDITNLASTQFEWTLAPPQPMSLVALLFHTLSLAAYYRLTLRAVGGTFAAPAYQTDWIQVAPRLHDSMDLDWLDPAWWLGHEDPAKLALRKRHLPIAVPAGIYGGGRLEFDDRFNPRGCIDVGGLWISSGFSPAMNFSRGRALDLLSRDQVDEAPSGRNFPERRDPRRSLTIGWDALTEDEAFFLADAAAQVRTTDTVLFIPDIENPASLVREVFPATFATPPSPKFFYPGLNTVAATFREILA